MTRTFTVITLVAAAALAGCNNSEPEIVGGTPAGDTSAAPVAPSALPPSIASSKIYRCADNQVVFVDWLSDKKTANVRTEEGGELTQLTSPEEGKPFTAAGGFEIAGAPGDANVRIAIPGKSAQACKA